MPGLVVSKIKPICPNHFWLAGPTLFSPIGKSIGCQLSPTTLLKHIRNTCNNQSNKDFKFIINWNLYLAVSNNVVLVYCRNIHILCSTRLIKCPWLGRQIPPLLQSTKPPSQPNHDMHKLLDIRCNANKNPVEKDLLQRQLIIWFRNWIFFKKILSTLIPPLSLDNYDVQNTGLTKCKEYKGLLTLTTI